MVWALAKVHANTIMKVEILFIFYVLVFLCRLWNYGLPPPLPPLLPPEERDAPEDLDEPEDLLTPELLELPPELL